MVQEEAFNNEIMQFLIDDPKSGFSKLINKIQDLYPHKKSFYSMIGSFVYELGFDFITIAVEVPKEQDKYIPCFKYYERNKLGEEARVEWLGKESTAMSIKEVYSFLGKETVYRLMRIPDLENFINKKSAKS